MTTQDFNTPTDPLEVSRKMNGISYRRVSTDDQARHGVSLANQAERIRQYCDYKGINLVAEIEDAGISGGVNKAREGFIELLNRVEAGDIDVIILYSVERLSRDMLTLLALERLVHECDVTIHTVEGALDTSTPTGWLSFAMKCLLAEHERRQIRFRTKQALEHKRNTGKAFNHEPFGYRREGDTLVPVMSEQALIHRVNEMYEAGETVARIAAHLNEQNTSTKQGKCWSSNQVKKLITNHQPTYQKRASRTVTAARAFIMAIG